MSLRRLLPYIEGGAALAASPLLQPHSPAPILLGCPSSQSLATLETSSKRLSGYESSSLIPLFKRTCARLFLLIWIVFQKYSIFATANRARGATKMRYDSEAS